MIGTVDLVTLQIKSALVRILPLFAISFAIVAKPPCVPCTAKKIINTAPTKSKIP